MTFLDQTSRIMHIRRQAVYVVISIILVTILSFFFVPLSESAPNQSIILGIIQIIILFAILYFFIQLKEIVRADFRLFLTCAIFSTIITILHIIFEMYQPTLFRTENEHGNYLLHSIFYYVELSTMLLVFISLSVIQLSKRARNDIILIFFIIFAIIFTFAIGIINLYLERRYDTTIGIVQGEMLYVVPYLTIFISYFFTKQLRRVLVQRNIFNLYLLGALPCSIWLIGTLSNSVIADFQINVSLLNLFHLLAIGIWQYGIAYHSSRLNTTEYSEYPQISRLFIHCLIFSIVSFIIISYFTNTLSIYFCLGFIIVILMVWLRLLHIRSMEKDSLKLLKENQSILDHAAHYDELTELPNRRKLVYDMNDLIEIDVPFTISLININRFQHIINLFSNEIGNKVLLEFVNRLHLVLDAGGYSCEYMYRLGSSNFVLLIPSTDQNEIEDLCTEIFDTTQTLFTIKNESIKISASIGNAVFPDHSTTVNDLLKYAYITLDIAKQLPTNQWAFYSKQLDSSIEQNLLIEKDLENGLENKEFELYYQPQYTISGELVSFEALIRWNHPTKGRVSPAEFITVAEETGLIVRLGEWILKEACMQLKQWTEMGQKKITMSINVSVRQLQQANFVERAKQILLSSGLDSEHIILEITETYPFYTDEIIVERIHELSRFGFLIAIDDFGTGFCSLASLTKFPIYEIKLAREFVDCIGKNSKDEILLQHTIKISEQLKIVTMAEGVETGEQLKILSDLGCQLIQGFYFSKPLDRQRATKLLSITTLQEKAKKFR